LKSFSSTTSSWTPSVKEEAAGVSFLFFGLLFELADADVESVVVVVDDDSS